MFLLIIRNQFTNEPHSGSKQSHRPKERQEDVFERGAELLTDTFDLLIKT